MADLLFDPDAVARVLDDLPALDALLRDPHAEGRPSNVFTGMKITDRALYRLLANPHYEHLQESLRAIDAAAAADRKLVEELCKANLRGQFGSYLQEAMLADHFLSRGLTVTKAQPGTGRNPDLEVGADGFDATVEVYSPRSWQWREDWLDDVRDTVKYADVPYAFTAAVDVVVHGLPVDADLLEAMLLDTGREVLRRITADLAMLDETTSGTTWTYAHQGGELTTSIEFNAVESNDAELDRWIVMSPPGQNYRVEPELDDVLRKIREKAEKRQTACGSGTLRGLAADVSRTGIDYTLESGSISLDAEAAARAGIDLDELGLDFIALTLPRRGKDGPTRGVRACVLFEDARMTRAQLGQLFDLA
jgi:hypothetical protein